MKVEHKFIADMFNSLCSKECWSDNQIILDRADGTSRIYSDYYDVNPDDIDSFTPAYEPSRGW